VKVRERFIVWAAGVTVHWHHGDGKTEE
jgi:hypothetical protein